MIPSFHFLVSVHLCPPAYEHIFVLISRGGGQYDSWLDSNFLVSLPRLMRTV